MTYLVAVSGGVDSVVLLDMLSSGNHKLIVAHFDHGIRQDSADDARFVEGLAKQYKLLFVSKREELDKNASEEVARNRRYAFLREEAKKHNATLVTAHHADDLIETIAINMTRGTGWRGLAVLDVEDVKRPLLALTKRQLYDYACDHRLEWVEDSTNLTDAYLRNRIRKKTMQLSDMQKNELKTLWRQQKKLKHLIEEEVNRIVGDERAFSRYFLTHSDTFSALEVLRGVMMHVAGRSLTRPQLQRALLAIKTAKPGSKIELGGGISLEFTARLVVVKTL